MLVEVKSDPAFSHLHIALNPGEMLFTRPGTVIGFETGLEVRTVLAEGRWQGTVKKCLGNPLLYTTRLRNIRDATRRLIVSPPTPGAIVAFELNNQSFRLQQGAFLACTKGVELEDQLRSFRRPNAGDGWFQPVVKGRGRVWLGAFGALVEKELDGELTLNREFLVASEESITQCRERRSRLPEGMIRIRGRGKVFMQTRSYTAMSHWLQSEH